MSHRSSHTSIASGWKSNFGLLQTVFWMIPRSSVDMAGRRKVSSRALVILNK